MDTIITLEGEALGCLIAAVAGGQPYRLRVAVDGGEVKIKVNEGTWTPGLSGATVTEQGVVK